ncbi:guanylate kinase [Nibricoccus sp. IMCC34717]|uniref:guanylate kinase n=1 Tax=Nibricoccus sp. IMCC34717 TaxID=3034021 RepID=UPI00384D0571
MAEPKSSAVPSGILAPVLLVIAGPAGSGKTTLCDRMVAETPGFSRVVTATTRAPREGEINGVHYHFLSAADFDQRVAEGAFLEWAWVHQVNRYGTLASSVLDPLAAGRSLIINVDVQGVDNFRRAAAANPLLRRHLATIFINVPLEELRARMVRRGQNDPLDIERRMRTAEAELREAPKFDFQIASTTRDADFGALQAIWRSVAGRVAAST